MKWKRRGQCSDGGKSNMIVEEGEAEEEGREGSRTDREQA